MSEEITINEGTGRDKVERVEETEEYVKIWINDRSGELREVIVPKKIIEYVENFIDGVNVGEKIKTAEVHMAFISDNKLESKISRYHINLIRESMEKLQFDFRQIAYLIEELENNPKFMLKKWSEHLGTRGKKEENYFKIWWSLRYWNEKGKIIYKGKSFTRVI